MTIYSPRERYKHPRKLQVNIQDYQKSSILAPFPLISAVISYKDDTEPVQLDSMRLAFAISGVKSYDIKYYFYILGIMRTNDVPIVISHAELKAEFKVKYRQEVTNSIERLVQAGLLFTLPREKTTYIVNPVYAWKGNRFNYLNLSALPDHTHEPPTIPE